MEKKVGVANYVCITSDIWATTDNLNAFLSVTGHWIDDEWGRQSALLELCALQGRHIGEPIGE